MVFAHEETVFSFMSKHHTVTLTGSMSLIDITFLKVSGDYLHACDGDSRNGHRRWRREMHNTILPLTSCSTINRISGQ